MASAKNADEPLKALVFADSCHSQLVPHLAAGKPLLNTPLLTWQLAVLARSGVDEAIVLSSTPIHNLYHDPLQRLHVRNIHSSSWNGEGDALRDIERRDDLRPTDDFVLVTAGSVFNLNVSKLLEQHKKRRKADHNWLISTVLRRGAGTAWKGLVVVVESQTGTLVKYTTDYKSSLPIDVMEQNTALQHGSQTEIVSNVLDCGLDICSPELLVEFRENFYYDRVRSYIREKLEGGEAEVFGNRMYAHFVDSGNGEYASRVTSLASLAQTTLDVLNGWMTPYEEEVFNDDAKEGTAHCFQSSYIVENSAIGNNVSIDIGSTVMDSVIGNNVQIGSDVTILRSIIMDGSQIADRSFVVGSILEEECHVLPDSIIPNNCFFKKGLRIGPACESIQSYSFFAHDEDQTTIQETDESDEESAQEQQERQQLENEEEREQNDDEGEQGEEEGEVPNTCNGRLVEYSYAITVDPFFIEPPKIAQYESDESDELEHDEDEDINGDIDQIQAGIGTVNLREGTAFESNADIVRRKKFIDEVFETIKRAAEERVEIQNTSPEINSLKMVYEASFPETLAALAIALGQTLVTSSSGASVSYAQVVQSLTDYNSVMSAFASEDIGHNTKVATYMAQSLRDNGTLLKYMFKAMHDMDFLEEEGILNWSTEERQRVESGQTDGDLLETMADFLDWLQQSDEEDE